MPSEDDVAFKLSENPQFQRAIIGPVNFSAFWCTTSGLDGEDLIVVQSVLKRAIELYVENHC